MRRRFIQTLTELALGDSRIHLITADLGYRLFDELAQARPEQYINVGIAEATMASMAAGMALEGMIPFIYSIVPFATSRCYEQLRNDIAYQEANVKIVGIGAGYAYGPNGPTHHGIIDIALMRALPGMVVLSPADPAEAMLATTAAATHRGPVYLRLGRGGEPSLHEGEPDFSLGQGIVLRDGRDVSLIATGSILAVALEAADQLAAAGVTTQVVSMPTVKPLDEPLVVTALQTAMLVCTLEEHSIIGGLGSAVAEIASVVSGPRAPVIRLGVPDRFAQEVGTQHHLRRLDGLAGDQVAHRVLQRLAEL
jgi:transketolase